MTRKSKRFRCRLCSAEHVLKTVTFWIQRLGSLTRVPIFFFSKWIKAMLSDSWCRGKFFVWKKNGEQRGCGGGFPHIGKLDMAFTLVCWPFCKALPKVEGTGEFSTFAHTTCMLCTINLALSQDLLYIIEVDLLPNLSLYLIGLFTNHESLRNRS